MFASFLLLTVASTVDGGAIRVVHDADIRSAAIEQLASSASPSSSTHSLPRPTDPDVDTANDASSKGTNLRRNFISCPPDHSQSLGIKLPVLTLVLKGMQQRFVSFEVQVMDDKGSQRRFRASNFQVCALYRRPARRASDPFATQIMGAGLSPSRCKHISYSLIC